VLAPLQAAADGNLGGNMIQALKAAAIRGEAAN
jgi:hypothetical protein